MKFFCWHIFLLLYFQKSIHLCFVFSAIQFFRHFIHLTFIFFLLFSRSNHYIQFRYTHTFIGTTLTFLQQHSNHMIIFTFFYGFICKAYAWFGLAHNCSIIFIHCCPHLHQLYLPPFSRFPCRQVNSTSISSSSYQC